MNERRLTREAAMDLLLRYNKSESLINHAKSVEAAMMHIARNKFQLGSEEVEKWGIIGLVHDLDYEQYPAEHCKYTEKILRENGWSEENIRAVLSHGWGTCTDVEPVSDMEKTLFAIDELTGLITACALVRPSKSIKDLEVKSVKKKWKEKAFASGASREIIAKGAEMLGWQLDELIVLTIAGMKEIAEEIGL